MKLTDLSTLRVTEDDPMTSEAEIQIEAFAADLPARCVPEAIMYALASLQQVPSFLESQIAANRGLIESIAAQP